MTQAQARGCPYRAWASGIRLPPVTLGVMHSLSLQDKDCSCETRFIDDDALNKFLPRRGIPYITLGVMYSLSLQDKDCSCETRFIDDDALNKLLPRRGIPYITPGFNPVW